MPVMIKNISASIEQDIQGNVKQLNHLNGQFGYGDWFKIGTVEAFLQNYKKIVSSENMFKSINIGLNINKRSVFKESL